MIKIGRLQAEEILRRRFLGRICQFHYPGYDPVCGKVDQIVIEELTGREPLVVIQMNDKRYTVSPDSLLDCLTVLRRANGNTH